MSRHLSDFRSSIVGPGGVKIGRCREAFGFVDVDDVAPQAIAARHADANSQIEPATKPEVVIRYIKDIAIRGKRTEALGDGFRELNDIIRFNVASFLARMDDPVRRVAMYDRTAGKVAELDCPKQYHLNMVLLFRAPTPRPPSAASASSSTAAASSASTTSPCPRAPPRRNRQKSHITHRRPA